MQRIIDKLRVMLAALAFVLAGTGCVYHGEVTSEWEYIIPQAPERSTQSTTGNESTTTPRRG